MFICLFLAVVAFILAGCAKGKYVPKPNEELYGTWTNEEMSHQKTVNHPDGKFEDYFSVSDTTPFRGGTTEIVKKWTDSEGNVWYNTCDTFTTGSVKGHKVQNLWKISKSGTVAEFVWSEVGQFDPSKFPTTIDPKGNNYFIFNSAGK
jgi:hypothetical protein